MLSSYQSPKSDVLDEDKPSNKIVSHGDDKLNEIQNKLTRSNRQVNRVSSDANVGSMASSKRYH